MDFYNVTESESEWTRTFGFFALPDQFEFFSFGMITCSKNITALRYRYINWPGSWKVILVNDFFFICNQYTVSIYHVVVENVDGGRTPWSNLERTTPQLTMTTLMLTLEASQKTAISGSLYTQSTHLHINILSIQVHTPPSFKVMASRGAGKFPLLSSHQERSLLTLSFLSWPRRSPTDKL